MTERAPMPPSVSSVLSVLALACALLLGACREPTEVVVVVDSDLQAGVDFDTVRFVMFSGGAFRAEIAQAPTVPATLGVVPLEFDRRNQFDITIEVTKGFDAGGRPLPVVTRRVSNIPFVPAAQRALLIEIWRECACNGTNCRSDPPCNDIIGPTLVDFDEDALPRLGHP
jgi:hypothetical protein